MCVYIYIYIARNILTVHKLVGYKHRESPGSLRQPLSCSPINGANRSSRITQASPSQTFGASSARCGARYKHHDIPYLLCVYLCTRVCMCVCLCTRLCVCLCIHTSTHTAYNKYISMYTGVYTHQQIYIYIYICTHQQIYIYISMYTGVHTNHTIDKQAYHNFHNNSGPQKTAVNGF